MLHISRLRPRSRLLYSSSSLCSTVAGSVRSTAASGSTVYESNRAVNEYLLSHYGAATDVMPYAGGPHDALNFIQRSVDAGIENSSKFDRALDVGCAVGGATFVLAKYFRDVVGIDFSQHFVDAANSLKRRGSAEYEILTSGNIFTKRTVHLDKSIPTDRVTFHQGDACSLDVSKLGTFDLVFASNILCRLPQPRKFIDALPKLLRNKGIVVLISPYSWLPEYTQESHWLGGQRAGEDSSSVVATHLSGLGLKLLKKDNISFLIREHERKFQYGVSELTVWINE